ncbi:hypothetical protein LL06_21645 [Hoeflea sp. BAL378]|uniref:hypothetical protein n=1 Tax=Hoeflea sp. BAL378 TaxID=1547437 RepID=UPI000512DA83|nr:hypothetical protein [Hoeflea sp. BAL378]KGF67549.1 hypothetical protein LL06_21645 [Hoeflea sp. BAL378]
MRDQTSAPQSRFRRLFGLAKLCRALGRLIEGRATVRHCEHDAWLRRDIGLAPDGRIGVSDVRAAFDRKLVERGQPWP